MQHCLCRHVREGLFGGVLMADSEACAHATHHPPTAKQPHSRTLTTTLPPAHTSTATRHTCRKRLSAISTHCIDSLSGSMKLSALAMAMNTSSLTRSGTPCLRIHSVTVTLSCSSTYRWPKMMAGSRPSANLIFSGQVSICSKRRGGMQQLSIARVVERQTVAGGTRQLLSSE